MQQAARHGFQRADQPTHSDRRRELDDDPHPVGSPVELQQLGAELLADGAAAGVLADVDALLPADAPIEIAGAWAWKVEDDGLLAASVNNFANSLASAITGALNSTLANTNAPADPNFLVNTIITALTGTGNFFGQFATTLTNLLNAFNISSDDITGSAFYVGVGSSGALGGIVDGVTSGVAFPAVAIPAVVVPPDIGGGSVFSLGTGTKNFTNNFTNGGVDGQYTVTYTFG